MTQEHLSSRQAGGRRSALNPPAGLALSAAVQRVRWNFEFYDRLVRTSPYDASGDPRDLPLITEQILAEQYYDTDFPLLVEAQEYRTSGTSSGRPKRILWSAHDHERYVGHRIEVLRRHVSDVCRTACADLGTGHAAASALEVFAALRLEATAIDFTRPILEHVAHLNAAQPDVLFTMPMILGRLLHEPGLKARPRKIVLVGDVSTEDWKRYVSERLGLERRDVMDLYGSIEVGSIAYECHRCQLYHFEDHILAEVLDAAALPTVDARAGQLVALTSEARDYFPAIRFVPNDLIEGFRSVPCEGRSRASFVRHLGRCGSELKHGEKLSLYDIASAVNAVLPGAAFDVCKTSTRLLIRIERERYSPSRADAIRQRLRQSAPSIDQMIRSSLVADFDVEPASRSDLRLGPKLAFWQADR